MLGKTNITALAESSTPTEIEDYRWVQVEPVVYTDFITAVYRNGYLVAITTDGQVVYTADGEIWCTAVLDYPACKINDVDWDGSRFILVGCCTDALVEDDTLGLAIVTTDFLTFEKLPVISNGTYNQKPTYYSEYIFVVPINGKYALVATYKKTIYSGVITEFAQDETNIGIITIGRNGTLRHCGISKNSAGALVYIHTNNSDNINEHILYRIMENEIKRFNSYSFKNVRAIAPFECKDDHYVQQLRAEENYALLKVSRSEETTTVVTGQNFAFTSAVYFNECQLFINTHEMLVVRKGESLSDKTVDDLIEIAPEMTMQCIVKAFDQLYIFGNRGLILRSSTETDNEEVIAVQTLSAKRALAEAKVYADTKYKQLEDRIAALEAR